MDTPAPTALFPRFNDLPIELRLEIWKFAAVPLYVRPVLSRTIVKEEWPVYFKTNVPSLLLVNRESRREAEKLFRRVKLAGKTSEDVAVFFPPDEDILVLDPMPLKGRECIGLCPCIDGKPPVGHPARCDCEPGHCVGLQCITLRTSILRRERDFLRLFVRASAPEIKHVVYLPADDTAFHRCTVWKPIQLCFSRVETITVALTLHQYDDLFQYLPDTFGVLRIQDAKPENVKFEVFAQDNERKGWWRLIHDLRNPTFGYEVNVWVSHKDEPDVLRRLLYIQDLVRCGKATWVSLALGEF